MGVGVGVSVVRNNWLNSLQFLYVQALSQHDKHKEKHKNTNTNRSRQQRASEDVREQNEAVGWTGLANGCFVHGDEHMGS